jgi:putative membrane protein
MTWGGELFFVLAPLLFFGGVILIAVLLIGSGRGSSRGSEARSALSILEERYARGEIAREEFLERREVLTRRAP